MSSRSSNVREDVETVAIVVVGGVAAKRGYTHQLEAKIDVYYNYMEIVLESVADARVVKYIR